MANHFHNEIVDELKTIIKEENLRQKKHIELIASENFCSEAVLKLVGSTLTNKYCEGYPNRRYYDGCEVIDKSETIAIESLKKLFACYCDLPNCKKANAHANVQPHSGSQANAEAYAAILKPGDTILGMNLQDGGHLTHGYKINFSGKIYNGISYNVNPKTGEINYEQVRELAIQNKPKVIVAGASAYSLIIDWSKFRKIADEVGAYLICDVAHIAGLIVTGLHPNPVCYADIITSTTHKTLRGPRGAIILCTQELAKKIDSAVFPGNQGGPLEHVIIAKAQAFKEAASPEFTIYQKQVLKNAFTFANVFKSHGFKIIGNKTENHSFTIDVKNSLVNLTGAEAATRLAQVNIIVNKNTIPNDTLGPWVCSGVRFGTPAMTTRGFKEGDFKILGHLIISIWSCDALKFNEKIYLFKEQVAELIKNLDYYDR